MLSPVKYHINPEQGPLPCDASTPDKCIYGRQGEPHFADKKDAESQWQKNLSEAHGTFSSSKNLKNKVSQKEKMEKINKIHDRLENLMEIGDFKKITDFANSNKENSDIAVNFARKKFTSASDRINKISQCSPHDKHSKNKLDVISYKSLLRDSQNEYVDACRFVNLVSQSKFLQKT